MDGAATWWNELRRAVLVLGLATLGGWLTGYFGLAFALAALILTMLWTYQLWRVSQWLNNPDSEPPEARGLWGQVFDSVYHLQRRDREERDRLQSSVSYLRDSFAALREAAIMLEPDGRIEWSNTAAERLLGLQYPRDRGQILLNLLRIPNFHAYIMEGDFSEPLSMVSPIDPSVRLFVEVTPFGHGSQIILARDVTREERLESMRRDFVANVSHELRTPLTVITGYLHTLVDNDMAESETIKRPLQQMRQQSERMETLLSDLLWLSQLESADHEVDFADIDMRELLQEIMQQFQEANPDRSIRLEVGCGCGLRGNHQQLYSAVSNLVVNALKYSDDEIVLSWEQGEGECLLHVTDRGPGIDAVHVPRLTERFYRVDKSRSLDTGGTGLGLAIVKHILAGHGAHLRIDSKIGLGSTFTCVFPVT